MKLIDIDKHKIKPDTNKKETPDTNKFIKLLPYDSLILLIYSDLLEDSNEVPSRRSVGY